VSENYEYLLPIFVGHPFKAEYTESLRTAINTACETINLEQLDPDSRFMWTPIFLHTLQSSNPESIYQVIRDVIRQSALCLFEITDTTKVNIFFELGVAAGMGRRLAIMFKPPYVPPSDLQGIRGMEYRDMDDLRLQIETFLRARVIELRSPLTVEQEITFQKMQIDALWKHRLKTVKQAMYFFAGDLSWVTDYQDLMILACQRGVTLRILCKRPKLGETKKWENIRLAKTIGADIKLFDSSIDPAIRGFIAEPDELGFNREALLIEKQDRATHSQEYERTGSTIGESKFLYKGYVYKGNIHTKHIVALIRLFETTWSSTLVEGF